MKFRCRKSWSPPNHTSFLFGAQRAMEPLPPGRVPHGLRGLDRQAVATPPCPLTASEACNVQNTESTLKWIPEWTPKFANSDFSQGTNETWFSAKTILHEGYKFFILKEVRHFHKDIPDSGIFFPVIFCGWLVWTHRLCHLRIPVQPILFVNRLTFKLLESWYFASKQQPMHEVLLSSHLKSKYIFSLGFGI